MNFEIINDKDKAKKIIHHNRLYPYTCASKDSCEDVLSDDEDGTSTSEDDTVELPEERRYPQRIRTRPERDGYVSWDVADIALDDNG